MILVKTHRLFQSVHLSGSSPDPQARVQKDGVAKVRIYAPILCVAPHRLVSIPIFKSRNDSKACKQANVMPISGGMLLFFLFFIP